MAGQRTQQRQKRQSKRLGAVPEARHRGRYLCKSRGKAPQTQPRLLRSAKTTGLSKFAWLLPHSSLCEKLGDFWGGNGAFTQDAPAGFFISKVDDCRCNFTRRGPAVDDNGDPILKLIADRDRRGAFVLTTQICRRGRDRNLRGLHYGERNLGIGHAQRDVTRVRRHLQRQFRRGFYDNRQRPWPETPRQHIEFFRQRLRQLLSLIHAFNQQRQRLVTRARFDVIYAVDRAQIKGIGGKAIKRVRRHAQHFAGANLVRRVTDQRRLGSLATYFYDLGAHYRPLWFRVPKIAET